MFTGKNSASPSVVLSTAAESPLLNLLEIQVLPDLLNQKLEWEWAGPSYLHLTNAPCDPDACSRRTSAWRAWGSKPLLLSKLIPEASPAESPHPLRFLSQCTVT